MRRLILLLGVLLVVVGLVSCKPSEPYEMRGLLQDVYTEEQLVDGELMLAHKIKFREDGALFGKSYLVNYTIWDGFDLALPHCEIGLVNSEYGEVVYYQKCYSDYLPE